MGIPFRTRLDSPVTISSSFSGIIKRCRDKGWTVFFVVPASGLPMRNLS